MDGSICAGGGTRAVFSIDHNATFLKLKVATFSQVQDSNLPEGSPVPLLMEEYKIDRKSFHTANGHMGLGADITENGDTVVVVPGYAVPLIIRQAGHGSGDTFKFIGEW